MLKLYSDILSSEKQCYEYVLSCVKLVVSDIHVSLTPEEIRMLVMIRMNHEFMEYMRVTYPEVIQTLPCRTSKKLMSMYRVMEDSTLLRRKMKKMKSRSFK